MRSGSRGQTPISNSFLGLGNFVRQGDQDSTGPLDPQKQTSIWSRRAFFQEGGGYISTSLQMVPLFWGGGGRGQAPYRRIHRTGSRIWSNRATSQDRGVAISTSNGEGARIWGGGFPAAPSGSARETVLISLCRRDRYLAAGDEWSVCFFFCGSVCANSSLRVVTHGNEAERAVMCV